MTLEEVVWHVDRGDHEYDPMTNDWLILDAVRELAVSALTAR